MAKAKESEELVLITPEQMVLITETIETKLAAANVTDQAIEKYRKEGLSLKINGPNDREGYDAVYEMRQKGKKTRVIAASICKAGREPLQAEVDEWIKKQTWIITSIKEVESYLQKMEDEYDDAKEQEKKVKIDALNNRAKERVSELLKLGVAFNGAEYMLDELSFSQEVIRECEADYFTNKILTQFKAIFDAKEIIRVANEKAIQEQRETEEKEREEFRKAQQKLKEDQDKIDKENTKLEEARQIKIKNLTISRSKELEEMGFYYSRSIDKWILGDWYMLHPEVLYSKDDEEWTLFIKEYSPRCEEYKTAKQKERDAEQSRLNQQAIDKAEKERQEKQEVEELRLKEQLAESTDDEKWNYFLAQVAELEIPKMTSRQYKELAKIANDTLSDLLVMKPSRAKAVK